MRDRTIADWEIDQILSRIDSCITYPSEEDDACLVVLGTTLSKRPLKVVVLADDIETVITVADRDKED